MKTLVVGDGIIGVLYGWALTEAGVDVTHYVRRGKAVGLEAGVELDLLDEREGHPSHHRAHYRLRATEQVCASDGYELVIVPVNAFQVEEVVRELAPRVGPAATFLVLSSNWNGIQSLDRLLPAEHCLLGYPDAGGTVREGRYWTNLGAEIHLGATSDAARPALAKVAALFARAAMRPDLPNNILHWLWVHNASVVGFALPFAATGSFEALLADRALLVRCLEATRELLRLCEARGVKVSNFPDVSYLRWMPFAIVIPLMRRLFRMNEAMQRYTAHAASPGALKESLLHYEAMLKTAEELEVPVPTLRGLKGLGPTAAG